MMAITQPADKLDFKSILPIIVIVFVDLVGLSIIIPLLPLYAARFSATPLVIGVLQATYPLMQFLGAPILGRLSDRYGRKPVLVASQIGTLAGFILLGFANTLFLLFLSRIIDGLSGANISTAQASISDSTNEKTRTQGLGLIGAAFGLGFILGPVIAFIVLAATGQSYQAVAFTAAFFSLASILLTFFWFRETKTGDSPSASARRPFSLAAINTAMRRPKIGFLLVLMFFYQIAFGGYEQLFSLFTLTQLGMDARDTSGLFVLAGLFIVIVQGGFIGRWSRQKGDRWLVILGISMLSLGLIGTALTPRVAVPWFDELKVLQGLAGQGEARVPLQSIQLELPEQSGRGWLGLLWLVIASFPAALGGAVLHPAVNSLITKSSDPGDVGGMLGVSAASYSAANAIAPIFYGLLFQWFGAPVPFMAGGLILLSLWLLTPRFLSK